MAFNFSTGFFDNVVYNENTFANYLSQALANHASGFVPTISYTTNNTQIVLGSGGACVGGRFVIANGTHTLNITTSHITTFIYLTYNSSTGTTSIQTSTAELSSDGTTFYCLLYVVTTGTMAQILSFFKGWDYSENILGCRVTPVTTTNPFSITVNPYAKGFNKLDITIKYQYASAMELYIIPNSGFATNNYSNNVNFYNNSTSYNNITGSAFGATLKDSGIINCKLHLCGSRYFSNTTSMNFPNLSSNGTIQVVQTLQDYSTYTPLVNLYFSYTASLPAGTEVVIRGIG